MGGLALTGGFSVLAASGFTGHASGASTRPRTAFLPSAPGTSPTTQARPTTTVPPATVPRGNGSNTTPQTQAPQTAPPTTTTTQPYVYVPDTTYYPPVTQSSGS